MTKITLSDLFPALLAGASLLLLDASGSVGAPAPFPRKARAESQPFVGTWKVIQADASGKHYGHETSRDQVWVIGPSKITIFYSQTGEKDEFAYLPTDNAPLRRLDLAPLEENITRLAFRAVYKIERGKLHFCRSTSSEPPTLDEEGLESRGLRRYTLIRVAETPRAK